MMKHLLRIAYHISLKFFITLPLTIAGIPILALGLLFVNKTATTLPTLLKWFDNADEDGLIGDVSNQNKNRKRGIVPNGYWAKLLWLGCRNPVNYFKYRVLGLKNADIMAYTTIYEHPEIEEEFVGDYRSGGTRYIEAKLKNGGFAYEYYLVKPYHLLNYPLCLRLRFGWKIGNPDEPQKAREYYASAATISLFCPFRGQFKSAVANTIANRNAQVPSNQALKQTLRSTVNVKPAQLPQPGSAFRPLFTHKPLANDLLAQPPQSFDLKDHKP